MDEKTRIQKDLEMFKDNLSRFKKQKKLDEGNKAVELATQYYQDAQYYLEKKDFFTSFGCINYAHGLLDAIQKYREA